MGCKLCGKPLAYEGALFCGGACSARWEGGERPVPKIERFECPTCKKTWNALDVPLRLPCTCAPEFMPTYLAHLEAHGERTEVFYYGPAVDRLQSYPTLIDREGKLYRIHAQAFASEAVYAKLRAEIAALKAAARDVVAQYDDEATSTTGPGVMKVLKDLVHPPLGAKR